MSKSKKHDDLTRGALPVFLCLIAAIALLMCCAGCKGTKFQGGFDESGNFQASVTGKLPDNKR